MTTSVVHAWKTRRTTETRLIEDALREAGFQQVDAYQYDKGSLRVRVVDSQFEGIAGDQRDELLLSPLQSLNERIRGDITTMLAFAPSELTQGQASILNSEFEDPDD